MICAAVLMLPACAGPWKTDYDETPAPEVTRNWSLAAVDVIVPETLTVSDAANVIAPQADIVWHGDPDGDRRAQVAAILAEAAKRAGATLEGDTPVTMSLPLEQFHAVTPAAVSRAPSAVHNIRFDIEVRDATTGETLVAPAAIDADLEAYVGSAPVLASLQGQTQKVRITDHLAAVLSGWLGTGPDQRRSFGSLGR